MITFEKNQPMATDPDWVVVTGGNYEPTDLVPVYRLSDPEQVVAWYAQFILDGTYP